MSKYWSTKFILILSFTLLLIGCNTNKENDQNENNIKEVKEIEEIAEEVYEEIDVTMNVDIENIQGKVIVNGNTNLPDGMKLMISISNESGYFAQDDSSQVTNRSFKTATFSNGGNALDDGTYTVKVTTPIANVQPSEVIKYVGDAGKNLTGDFVVISEINGNTVEYQEDFLIENSNSSEISHKPTDDDIYNFMENEFDRITNYGADYIPEIHDSQVLKNASEKFEISESEADRIYLDKVMSQFK